MGAIGFFLAGIGITLGATALAVRVLRRPLSNTLAELCGSRRRGEFWVAVGSICMLLAATAASTFPDSSLHLRGPVSLSPASGHPASSHLADLQPLLLSAIMQCAFGLVGVLISLSMVVGALFASIRRFEERFRYRGEHP